MAEQLIDYDRIVANPYQKRAAYTDIETLARSIAAHGLQQLPKARLHADQAQLKFGHRRWQAFGWLRANYAVDGLPDRYCGYTQMPLDVEELTDEEMYCGVVIENVHRNDLNPIELAEQMLIYREQFGKTSKEIGELFGCNDASVRGTLRLLDLPDEFRQKVAAGEMTIGAARKVLSVKHLVSNLNELAQERFSTERSVDEIIQSKIANGVVKLITMWSRWQSGEPCGGDSLWPLGWTYETPPWSMPTEKEFLNHWQGPSEVLGMSAVEWARMFAMDIMSIQRDARKSWEELYQENSIELHPLIDMLKQLAEPPACTACSYYVKNEGNHLCALKACWNNKFERWVSAELRTLSQSMGFETYQPERDGRVFEKLETYHDQDRKWFDDRHPGLRLMVKKSTYKHGYTDSLNVCLVMTGAEAEQAKQAEAAARAQQSSESYEARYKRDEEKRVLYRDSVRGFVVEQACPVFAVALDGLAGGLLKDMARHVHYDVPAKFPPAQKYIFGLVWSMDQVDGYARLNNHPTPVQYAAKHLQGVARTWGVKLPPDWLEIAARYEPDLSAFPECCVSAETSEA